MNKMKTIDRFLIALACLFATNTAACIAQDIAIIPKPTSIERQAGTFELTQKTTIGYDETLEKQAAYLQEVLSQSTGWTLTTNKNSKKTKIQLKIDRQRITKPEGYQLHITPKQVVITGADAGGVFYGIQSLLQLFPSSIYHQTPQKGTSWTLPAVTINDAPDHPWRGMMLDVARYFFDKDFVKRFIDMMATYKMNKLQFHLIDDSGWRLEIKKYPRLTEVGAWSGPKEDRLGGFYTQDDIRELIAYAQVRNVEIIPEIEFPAHVLSAIVAYPHLSCTGLQHEVPTQHFISRDLLCVGKESTIKFLEDVLAETVELFPSKYINIGGDEAVYDRWKECPNCQALMKREKLTEVGQLQGYLTNVVSDMMRKKGRTIVGWEEIIKRGTVHNPAVAVFWHNTSDSIHATKTGHKAILNPATHTYLDFPESKTPGEVKAATWLPPISMEKCYSMEINDYSPTSTVLGVQGAIWTDQFIHGTKLQEIKPLNENRSERYMEYLVFPRLLAISELGWCKTQARSYSDFSTRLEAHYAKLDAMDCNYRIPEPVITRQEQTDKGITFTLRPSVPQSTILYTTDGSYPTIHSPRYSGPVQVADKSDFHAMTLINNRRYSLPIHFSPDYSAYKQFGTFTADWSPLQVQTTEAPMQFEATGKITANGRYEITFVRTKGTHDMQLGKLELLKRDEQIAEATQSHTLTATHPAATYTLTVTAFEAGTPFFIKLHAKGINGNDASGLMFIKKLP